MVVKHFHSLWVERDAAYAAEDHEGAEEAGDDPVCRVESFHGWGCLVQESWSSSS